MDFLERILNLFHRQSLPGPTLETVAAGWSISPAHAEFYVQLYASRYQLTYQQALNLLQDLPFENVQAELGAR
jgi:hypothetical protein